MLALVVGALCFWVTLNIVDYGFYEVLRMVFP